MTNRCLTFVTTLILPASLVAQQGQVVQSASVNFQPKPPGAGAIKVGPEKGTLVIVGGGSMGPEIYKVFIDAAGGPDAPIVDVPNAGGAASYDQSSGRSWRNAGATDVFVLHTTDRKIADSDSFVAPIKRAGGVWFDGGRQFRLVDDYGGTKTEAAFNEVLARGGVVGGSSAGASIIGDFMVRGAPSSNNMIMAYPGYEKGFGYLRNVGVDQHVVARERLPDLADSIIPRFPTMLGISVDEGTAWVIKGDTGRIVGRSKGFVYNGADNDPGSPFLSLFPGDVYNLNTRKMISRALDRSPIRLADITAMFAKYGDPAAGGATVLVARNGEVLIDHAFGIPAQPRHMPRTTVPQFNLGGIGAVFTAICDQMPAPAARGATPPDSGAAGAAAARGAGAGGGAGGRGRGAATPPTPLQSCVSRVASPVGMQKTTASADGAVMSSVDALYRLALGLEVATTYRGVDYARGWQSESYKGVTRLSAYGADGGKRSAFVRVPERKATIIILTNDANADAKGMADRILDQLLSER